LSFTARWSRMPFKYACVSTGAGGPEEHAAATIPASTAAETSTERPTL